MRIVLRGEPKSTQHIYQFACKGRFPVMYMTAKGKQLKADYQLQARAQWKKKPTSRPIALDILLYFGTKRRADIDNFQKLSWDSLTGVVYNDDSQIDDLRVRRRYDKKDPRIEIEITHARLSPTLPG